MISNVTRENILSVLSNGMVYQPFRFQPHLTLCLSYDTYKSYIKYNLKQNSCFLSYAYKDYKMHENNDEILKRLYQHDISRSVICEVIMSHEKGKDATVIIHSFEDCNLQKVALVELPSKLIGVSGHDIARVKSSFQNDLRLGTILPDITELSNHNKILYIYALILRLGTFKVIDNEFEVLINSVF